MFRIVSPSCPRRLAKAVLMMRRCAVRYQGPSHGAIEAKQKSKGWGNWRQSVAFLSSADGDVSYPAHFLPKAFSRSSTTHCAAGSGHPLSKAEEPPILLMRGDIAYGWAKRSVGWPVSEVSTTESTSSVRQSKALVGLPIWHARRKLQRAGRPP